MIPFSERPTSVQPVNKFNLFHSLSPCLIKTNFIFKNSFNFSYTNYIINNKTLQEKNLYNVSFDDKIIIAIIYSWRKYVTKTFI